MFQGRCALEKMLLLLQKVLKDLERAVLAVKELFVQLSRLLAQLLQRQEIFLSDSQSIRPIAEFSRGERGLTIQESGVIGFTR